MSDAYTLRVPVAKDHWILLVSNKEMTSAAFAALDRYLVLQKEIAAEDNASAMSAGTAETQSGSGLRPASAVPERQTPQPPVQSPPLSQGDE